MASLKGLDGGVGDPRAVDSGAPGSGGYAPVARPWTAWDALKVFSLRSLVFALVLGALAAAGGAAVALGRPSVYSSEASLLIDQPKLVQRATDQGPLQKLALLRFKYLGLATTPAIAGPAASTLGLTETHVANEIFVTAPPTSLLLIVTAQASTSSEARGVTNAVAHSIVDYTDREQGQIEVAPADRYEFAIVNPASSPVKIQPTKSKAAQTGVALGVVAMAFVYLLMQLVTAGVRSP